MKIQLHQLAGCSPTPLAHYLKALGILRLLAEQKDSAARGWWQDDVFHVATTVDRSELEVFFLNEYSPTPMVAPWNGGSGFYPKDNKSGIEPIEQSTAPRFAAFREAISKARKVVAHLKEKPNKGSEKNEVICRCRLAWRDGSQHWIDAALAIDARGEPSFPALLGTGGNDGRLDFTTNLMQRIVSLFDVKEPAGAPNGETVPQLKTALWGDATATLEKGAIGQFLPGAAGGPNGTSGFEGGVRVNPWDYVFMLEGAILFRAGLSRKCAAQHLPQAAAPFAVRASSSGYGSSDAADASARGEQWMPLWKRPSSLHEIEGLLREGRTQLQGKTAERGTDMARAVARMGVARGISSFERYGYIERNGLANLAVPLGRFEVRNARNQELIDEAAPFVERLRRLAGSKNAPESFDRVHRACEETIITCTRSDDASTYLSLLVAMGQAEDQIVRSPKFSADNFATPMPKLSSRWLDLVWNDDDHEFRLALALAAQFGSVASKKHSQRIRLHWVPLDGSYFEKGEGGLRIGPEQCAVGLDLERALVAVVNRRLIAMNNGARDKNENGGRTLPLHLATDQVGARLVDIEAFLEHRVDDARILAIARGLMSVDLTDYRREVGDQPKKQWPLGGLATYGVLRLATPVRRIRVATNVEKEVRCNSLMYRRLQTGDLTRAINCATRQLVAVGLRPRIQFATGTRQYAHRLAASLGFGISRFTFTRLALGLTQPKLTQSDRQRLASKTEV